MTADRACALLLALLLVARASAAQAPVDLDALENQAVAAFSAGQAKEAIEMFTRLQAGRKAAGDPALEARAGWRLATAFRGLGRTADAVAASARALDLATRAGAHAMVADLLAQLHQLNAYSARFPTAKRLLDEALNEARRSGNPRTLARVHDTRGRWLGDEGPLAEAIDEINQGLVFARSAADDALIAGLLSVRSVYANRGGRLGDALSDALLAREAAAKVGPRAEVQALFTLAQANAHLSNFDESARQWTEVLERYRQIGPPIGVAMAIDARAHVWYELQRDDLSLADARAAMAAYEALNARTSVSLYSRAALASIRQGQIRDGEAWLAEAERRLSSAPDFEQIQTLQQMGMAYLMLGDATAAREIYSRMLVAGRRRGSLEDEWKAQLGLGRAAMAAHAPDVAAVHLEASAQTIETLRTTVPAQELRAAYLARRVEAHEWLVASLMQLSRTPTDSYTEAAFNAAERARVRALADLLAEGRARRAPGRSPPVAPRARSRAEIAATLGPGDALIEYLVGEQDAFGWLLTRDELIGFRLPPPKSIDADVRLAVALIGSDDRAALRQLGERLTPALLGPALPRLKDFRRILFVPDGALQRLPFAALAVPGSPSTYLAQHLITGVVGSGSLLELLDRDSTARAPLLALAASGDGARLPETAGEISDAMRLLDAGPTARSMPDATEMAVKSGGLADYKVIHIAAHAVVDEAFPRNSAVRLVAGAGEDGDLRASEISQIPVDADLVVLAACRTQMGRILRGEGLLSLARSFMEAGAKAVVASQWDVDDRQTRVLMRGFYSGIRGGLSADEALRVAQLQLIRTGGALASPQVWAGFQVSGEGRRAVFPRPAVSTFGMWAAGFLILGLVGLWRRQTSEG